MSTISTPECPLCLKTGTIVCLGTMYHEYTVWELSGRKAFIQDALPSFNVDQREQILTGYHPQCWDDDFGAGE